MQKELERALLACNVQLWDMVTDKATCNYDELRGKLALWEEANNLGALAGREWAYEGCKPRIIIEKFLEDTSGGGNLSDYKLMFFNGKFRSLYG